MLIKGDISKKYDLVIMLSTYNGERFLKEQIESIIEQKYKGQLLLYVRDDVSTDKTIEILNQLSSKIDIKLLSDNQKIGAANSYWKLLVTAPEAEYYAFVDQDDIWDSEKIQEAISALKIQNDMSLWFSDCRIVNNKGQIMLTKMNQKPLRLNISTQLVCGMAQGCAMVFNKKLIEYIRSLDIQYIPMHDTVVLCYALINNCVIYNPLPYFSYRVHDNNFVAKEGKNFWGKVRSTYQLWIKHRGEISNLVKDILRNEGTKLKSEERVFLEDVAMSRYSLNRRLRVINSKYAVSSSDKGLRSFKIRALLGLL